MWVFTSGEHAMSTIDFIENHRSIRKYKKKNIDPKILEKILSAGTRASTSGNMQAYSIIVTTEPSLKQKLLPLHFNQEMVVEAPALITFCGDFHRMRRWLEQRQAPANFDNFMSFMIATIDATLVSQNVALAAEGEGLGVCYLGTTLANCENIGDALNLPPHVIPVVGFAIGYPDEVPDKRDRLPLEAIVHHETYQDYTNVEILNMYARKEKTGWERYNSLPELKKLIEKEGVTNLAQIYTKVKYTKSSHHQYSNTVLNYLQAQQFMENG